MAQKGRTEETGESQFNPDQDFVDQSLPQEAVSSNQVIRVSNSVSPTEFNHPLLSLENFSFNAAGLAASKLPSVSSRTAAHHDPLTA